MSDSITLKTEQIINSYYKITGNSKGSLAIDDYLKFRDAATKEVNNEFSIENCKNNTSFRTTANASKRIDAQTYTSDAPILTDAEREELEKPFVVIPDTRKEQYASNNVTNKQSKAVDILNSIAD